MGTSPSAVPAKRSAQGERRGGEKEEEEAAGSSAKRRKRQGCHENGKNQQLVSLPVYTYDVIPLAHLIMVYTDCALSTLTG